MRAFLIKEAKKYFGIAVLMHFCEQSASCIPIKSPAEASDTEVNDVQQLLVLLNDLVENEKNELLNKHFSSLIVLIEDDNHGIAWTETDKTRKRINGFSMKGQVLTHLPNPKKLIEIEGIWSQRVFYQNQVWI